MRDALPIIRSGPGEDAPVSFSEGLPAASKSMFTFVATDGTEDWLIWQLADSAFPSGGFAHSSGLEAAWQNGEIQNRVELASFFEASLQQIGHSVLPFVTAAHGTPGSFFELDSLCEAFTTNHVANRASCLQGRAFLASAEKIFGVRFLEPRRPQLEPKGNVARAGQAENRTPLHGHFAPVFGAVTSALGLSRRRVSQLFFFQYLRGLVASAVRLGVVGPMEAQALQHRLAPRAQEILLSCENLDLAEMAQTSPLLEIWQGTQDRLYSRLFQS